MTNPDRVLIRGKDIGLIVGILTLCSLVWKFSAKPLHWDEAYDGICLMKPRVETLEKKEDEMEAKNQAQMTYIIRELDSIDKKIGR
jgi:hypothetical protein